MGDANQGVKAFPRYPDGLRYIFFLRSVASFASLRGGKYLHSTP